MALLGFSHHNHITIQSEINQINYNTVEAVTSLGAFPESLYFSLLDEINRYSRGTVGDSDTRYQVTIKLDKNIKDDVYDTYFLTSDQIYMLQDELGLRSIRDINTALLYENKRPLPILNEKLNVGDRISIYLEDRTPTIFGNLSNFQFGFTEPKEAQDIRIISEKSSVIANDTKTTVTGYEVVVAIAEDIDEYTAIVVQTKLSGAPRYYGYASHPALQTIGASTRLTYGNTPDEQGQINTATGGGKHFIYGPGTFTVTETWKGVYRTIQYTQE